MKSPFPGMDPYLEHFWHDIHAKLVAYSSAALNEVLPDDLIARSEERVAVDTDDPILERSYRPDVIVTRSPSVREETDEAVTVDAPIKLIINADPIIERFVKILHADDESLVTVIEFLSPTNKVGEGLIDYRRKRDDLVAGGVNVVEVDLIRRGDWRALLRPATLDVRTPYRVITRIGSTRNAYAHAISFNDRLPDIQIPLRKNDPKIKLALQPLLDEAYRSGRYARSLKYDRPLDPPPTPEEAAAIQRVLLESRSA